MSTHKSVEKLHEFWKHRKIPVFMLAAVLCVSLFTMGHADALYILTGNSDSPVVLDESADEETVKNFSSKLVYVDRENSGYEVTLKAGQNVTVDDNGATITALAKEETISELLSRLHLTPGPQDMVLVDLSGSAAKLKIGSTLSYYDTCEEKVSHPIKRVKSVYLPAGREKVVQEGSDGTRTATYKVVYENGKLVSRELVRTENNTAAVDEIVAVGTVSPASSASGSTAKVTGSRDGILTLASGKSLAYSAVKTMSATAYTTGTGGAGRRTATGTTVHVGVVAVDPRVIPLGSKLYIVASNGSVIYGYAVAEDTGVFGNTIDLYYNTYAQCISFGRRSCQVYLLK